MFRHSIKAALIVDFDNLARTTPDFSTRIDNWVAYLEDGAFDPAGLKRNIVSKAVYWNSPNDRYRAHFDRAGFDIKICIARRNERGSSADFDITVDALELFYQVRGLREVIILSFDTDILPVQRKLREKGVAGVAMVNAMARAPAYRVEIDAVITDVELRNACAYVRPKRNWFGRKAVPAAFTPSPPQQPAPRPPAPRGERRPPPLREVDLSRYDMADAAARILALGKQYPGRALTKRMVVAQLRSVEGFTSTPPEPYFGFGEYPYLSAYLADAAPGLSVESIPPDGYFALVYREPEKGEDPETAVPNEDAPHSDASAENSAENHNGTDEEKRNGREPAPAPDDET
jgi:hypothetical protein